MSNTVTQLLDLLSRSERRELVIMLFALFVGAAVDMVGVASLMPFMAVVANPGHIDTNWFLSLLYSRLGFVSHAQFLFWLGVFVFVMLVLTNAFKAFMNWWTLRFDNRLNAALSSRLLERYMARPYTFFLNRNTAEMNKNVLTDVRTVINGVLSSSMNVISSVLGAVLLLVLLFAVNPQIAITIAGVIGTAYAAIYLAARSRLAKIGEEQVVASSMKYKAAAEALGGIKDIKVLGRERMLLARFAEHAKSHGANNVIAGTIAQVPRYALEVIAFGGILLIVLFFLGSNLAPSETISLLALYAFAGYRLLPAVQQIFAGVSTIRLTSPTLDAVHADMTNYDQANSGIGANFETDSPPLPFSHCIELRDLAFTYPNSSEPVLRTLNVMIPRNKSIGLVGATGSGKTTTVDIILGLLEPDEGALLVDDIRIGSKNVREWQRNLGYVPQHIFLCDDTIASNIAFGVPESEIDFAAVVRAARVANLHHFVEQELPQQYGTIVGERGVRLSGGQRQRIGIARALYRDPPVLIMDEATSALDGITEDAVMDALHTLAGEKTIIMIAHRLTTVKGCDVIYLLERGQVLEQGRYEELLKSSSWFRAASRIDA
jgi:ABC-type multidrug transport system fused ATPase/permease subunit